MNINDLFPESEYLKSEDVEAAGGELELTITNVGRKEYEKDGVKEVKGLLTFAETSKKLTLNTTNTHIVASMYGSENIDRNWPGKRIIQYVDYHVKFQGKETKGIRIRLVDPKQDAVTAFWAEARKLGYSREDGLKLVKDCGGDFVQALKSISADADFPA